MLVVPSVLEPRPARQLVHYKLNLHSAKVNTLSDRAEDVFLVSRAAQFESSTEAGAKELPSKRVAEVEDFIGFLRARETGRALTRAASKAAEPSFGKLWDNDADAAYDRL